MPTDAVSTEIIDLTVSPQSPILISSDSPDIHPVEADTDTHLQEKSGKQNRVEDGEPREATNIPSKDDKGKGIVRKLKRNRYRSQERAGAVIGSSTTEEMRRGELAHHRHTRRRSHSRDRDYSPARRRRRSHSPEPRNHHRRLSPETRSDDNSSLFFADAKPVNIPNIFTRKEPSSNSIPNDPDACISDLILPAHVSVIGSNFVPVEIHSPTISNQDENEDDYINFLDYDDDRRAGIIRYFDETTVESQPTRLVCKHCGVEGEHKTRECTVLICLTCGSRGEHSTRSCPISKTCYTCGMRGHINKTCPNRRISQNGGMLHDDCDRCGARSHYTNECPTLWRMYEFVTDQDRDAILRDRDEKRDLAFGHGGEGYIGPDDWCYNCGDCGHLGDDCMILSHPPDFPREPSAFSEYNLQSGPFFNPAAESKKKKRTRSKKKKRDFDAESGFPTDVGKKGRKKEIARMEKIAAEQVEDEEDWFNNPSNVKNRGMDKPTNGKRKSITVDISDGKRFRGSDHDLQPPSAPALLARIGDSYGAPSTSSRHHKRNRDGERTRDRYHKGRSDYDSRNQYRDRPMWSGGYS